MKILVIGGTGFIGTYVVRELCEMGHDVALFNRCKNNSKEFFNLTQIKGDIKQLPNYIEEFKNFSPQVVLHMIAMTENDAQTAIDIFKGITERIVVLSSMDVYRAYGLIKQIEIGEVISVPFDENAPLRTKLHPYGGDYEKILVENSVMNNPSLPGTILRLPMVYGPGDPHRIYMLLKRMIDKRPFILLDKNQAKWCGSRGYVENVAKAIALATTNERAANRIYNVSEHDLSEEEWAREIARSFGWEGEFKSFDRGILPKDVMENLSSDIHWNLLLNLNFEQHWVTDSTRIREELDYKESMPFKEGIERTVLWNIDNPPPKENKQFKPNKFVYECEDKIYKILVQ